MPSHLTITWIRMMIDVYVWGQLHHLNHERVYGAAVVHTQVIAVLDAIPSGV